MINKKQIQKLLQYLQYHQDIVKNFHHIFCKYSISVNYSLYWRYDWYISDLVKYLKKNKQSIKIHEKFLKFLNKLQINCKKFNILAKYNKKKDIWEIVILTVNTELDDNKIYTEDNNVK